MYINKIFIFALALCAVSLSSQAIDQKYLDSLPEDIRKDLLEKADEKDELDKPVYSNQSTQIDKAIDDNESQDKLKVFGDDFFSTYQSTFMPINEPNFASDYILDYGDVIEIQLIGQENSIDSYQISRGGFINIPTIGSINLSGLSLAQASSLIKVKARDKYIGTEAHTYLESIRDINVLVAGNAFNPGIYTLSGNSNPLQALVMAGGINEYGSYRDIKVKRNNNVIHTLDIYDYLIYGNIKKDLRLRSGELIFVEKRQNLVTVDGAVKRPLIYELKNDEMLDKAIFFANGLDVDADLKNITLDRISDGLVSRSDLDSINDLSSYTSYHKDVLNIRRFKFRNASISGSVNNPGSYLMNEGDTIYDLVNRAGGYSKNAYPFGGIFNNKTAKEITR